MLATALDAPSRPAVLPFVRASTTKRPPLRVTTPVIVLVPVNFQTPFPVLVRPKTPVPRLARMPAKVFGTATVPPVPPKRNVVF